MNRFGLSKQGEKDLKKGVVYSALANLSMMMPVGISIMVLDDMIKPLFEERASLNLFNVIVLVILASVVMWIFHYLQYTSVYLGTYKESETRRIELAEKLRYLPLSFFSKKDLSDLTSTIMNDCETLEHAYSHAIPQLFGAIISTAMIIIGLFAIDVRMGVASLWVVPVAFIIIFISKKIQQNLKSKHHSAKLVCAQGIQECLENIQDIKANNMQKSYLENLDEKFDVAEKEQICCEFIVATLVTSAQAVLRLGMATVILVGSTLLINGQIDLITYLIFLIAASRLYEPLSVNLINIAEIFSMDVCVNRMKNIYDKAIQDGDLSYDLKNYDIEFENVAFSYNDSDVVLNDVSFVAKQGEITALVGPSGGGKSTVAKLGARFWDANLGKITLGGCDISKIDPEKLLENYAIVFQDVTLFNDTLLENIRLGRKDASDEEVLNAASIAMCDDFALNLPNGYNEVIGENGSTLSGGERQRVSIARALLKDAPIILLDEATASLDVENETKIQSALSHLIKNKTVLVIAHRLRTIEGADKIVVLSDGYVIEQGNHDELMQNKGLYCRLYSVQKDSSEWSI